MDAVKFLQERKRMVDKLKCSVDGCAFCTHKKICKIDMNFNDYVTLIETWSKENPLMTYKSEFFKLFPNSQIDIDGYPMVNIFSLIRCDGFNAPSFARIKWDSQFKGWD